MEDIIKKIGEKDFKIQFSISFSNPKHGSHGFTTVTVKNCINKADAKSCLVGYIEQQMYPNEETNTFIYSCVEQEKD